eukprot:CAMPEP_0172052096 /NCGR_PEP_ID=MMETSP1043-20130122/3482_1 /TAXON_ID=464988 /ORGANISM="Hemiselmis andersenii, Strain CCMP441" /LENGTH=243 /DNA_ID=CAMNT_0012711239 /DNA_START=105 /DNA_END=832 /DNA_ORIENTATION=+
MVGMEDYNKIRKIGRGAMGVCWLVKRKADGQQVVAKEISVVGLSDKEQLEAMREVEVLRKLQHPNVITLHSAFIDKLPTTGNALYIIMEHADAGDLAAVVKRGRRMTEAKILNIFGQMCVGLPGARAFSKRAAQGPKDGKHSAPQQRRGEAGGLWDRPRDDGGERHGADDDRHPILPVARDMRGSAVQQKKRRLVPWLRSLRDINPQPPLRGRLPPRPRPQDRPRELRAPPRNLLAGVQVSGV